MSTQFLTLAEINAILEAGGTPWSLISKESGEILGTVRTRTIAREIAPGMNAKIEKYSIPQVEEIKPEAVKVEEVKVDQPSLPEIPEVPKEIHPGDLKKCPQCGSEEIFHGRTEMDKKGSGMGFVVDEEFCGGCHHCDWTWNLIDVNRKKSVVENPTRLAWDIADAMLLSPRKDVVKAMIAAGIANGTSRTQYQYWFNVNKARKLAAIEEDKIARAKALEESKKSK